MRALSIALAGAILASAPAAAQTVEEQALLHQLSAEVRPERMRADIEALVGFGTRHTMSETASDTRGIGAARRWATANRPNRPQCRCDYNVAKYATLHSNHRSYCCTMRSPAVGTDLL